MRRRTLLLLALAGMAALAAILFSAESHPPWPWFAAAHSVMTASLLGVAALEWRERRFGACVALAFGAVFAFDAVIDLFRGFPRAEGSFSHVLAPIGVGFALKRPLRGPSRAGRASASPASSRRSFASASCF